VSRELRPLQRAFPSSYREGICQLVVLISPFSPIKKNFVAEEQSIKI